ncbi:MAG: twin-arginine translocation signal domain-containing protein [Motiliproteus sp.]
MNKNNYQIKTGEVEVELSSKDDMSASSLSRRKFITKGTIAVASVGVLAMGVGGVLVSPQAWAASVVGDRASETLLRLARDIYPHDTLDDKYYTQVMLPMGESANTDKALAKLLIEGVSELDQRANDRFGMGYLEVKQEADRVVILREMESSAFFQKVKGAVMMGIYNNPELWPWFGFGGSSWEQGGYINRGFDKIDWL